MSIHARHPTDSASVAQPDDGTVTARSGTKRALVGGLVAAGVIAVAAGTIVFGLSKVDLSPDGAALAQVHLGTVAGTLTGATAHGPHGGDIPVAVRDGAVTPLRHVPPGTTITVAVQVHRPGWVGWALGHDIEKEITVRTPSAHLQTRWTTVRSGASLRVAFDQPVARLAYGTPGHVRHVVLRHPQRVVNLGRQAAAGSLAVAGAPRTWEQLPQTREVTWFPAGAAALAVSSPAPGGTLGPLSPLKLTFSKPLSALGSAHPTFATPVAGRWRRADAHTLVFKPSGTGYGLGATVQLTLPAGASLVGANGPATTTTTAATTTTTTTTATTTAANGSVATWTVPPGSTLRLHELLAQLGYLPLTFHAAHGAERVAPDDGAQLSAAVDPPKGSFSWRWSLPSELTSQWSPATASAITRGALMKFQSDRGLTTDGLPGPSVWSALFAAAREHKVNTFGYSYVLVHRDAATQTATVIHNGKTVVRTLANTGVPAAPTELGTFPVYLRYTETTMVGTNPDGSRYNDPGIKWVSYFNGGDALHAFDRASYGTPQSVGCVEMPESEAGKIYPYTPIGTLVQIAP
ncbi:MAG TPA: L,D-transpeptidase family protein [Conexibacter sp.]|nr:L,D-transpeptidase family protein [Conexibacter sp.]